MSSSKCIGSIAEDSWHVVDCCKVSFSTLFVKDLFVSRFSLIMTFRFEHLLRFLRVEGCIYIYNVLFRNYWKLGWLINWYFSRYCWSLQWFFNWKFSLNFNRFFIRKLSRCFDHAKMLQRLRTTDSSSCFFYWGSSGKHFLSKFYGVIYLIWNVWTVFI